MSRMRSMPTAPMSSRRPRNGLMYVAPALALSSAWGAEKQSVWFMRMPLPERYFTAFRPSAVSGTFTTTLGATWPSATPSLISLTFAVSRKIFMLSTSVIRSDSFYRNPGPGPDLLEDTGVAADAPDHGDRAGRPDLVALAHRRGAEEDAERLAGRPVAEIAEGHGLLRGVGGCGERQAEVDLVAPRLGLGRDRKLGGDGRRRARVVQLAGRGDTPGGDPNRARHAAG